MRIIPLIITCFGCSLLQAQTGKWTILVNNKTRLSTREENQAKNSIPVNGTEWKKNGKLEIRFDEDNKNEWYRSFLFTTAADEELLRKDSSSRVTIPLTELRKLFAGNKQIIIYTTITPRDPNLAIRIRRVHLCTLQLP